MLSIITLASNLSTLQDEPEKLICGLGADIYPNDTRQASLISRVMLCFFRAVNFLIGCFRSLIERKWVPIIEKRVQFALFLTYEGFKQRMEEVKTHIKYINDLYPLLKTNTPLKLDKFREARNTILHWHTFINHLVLPPRQTTHVEAITEAIAPYFKCVSQHYSFPHAFKKIPTLRDEIEQCEDFFIYMEKMGEQFPPIHLFNDVEGNKSEIKRWLRTTVEKSIFGYAIAIVVRCLSPKDLLKAFYKILKDDPKLLEELKQGDPRQQKFCDKLAAQGQLVHYKAKQQIQVYPVIHGPTYYTDGEDCLFTVQGKECSWTVFVPRNPLTLIILSCNILSEDQLDNPQESTDLQGSAIALFPFLADDDASRFILMKNEGKPLGRALSEPITQQALIQKIEQWKKEDRQPYDPQPENFFYYKDQIYTNRVYRYTLFSPIPVGRFLFQLHSQSYAEIVSRLSHFETEPQIQFYRRIASNVFQDTPLSINRFIEQLPVLTFRDVIVSEGKKIQDKLLRFCARHPSKMDAKRAFESKIPLDTFLGYHPDLQ